MPFNISMLILRFVVSFVTMQAIAVAGCIFAFKQHRRLKVWLAALAAVLYLNSAYFFLFNPVDFRQQSGAVIDYALIYPFFAYMLICIALAPLFFVAAAVTGIGKVFSRFGGTISHAAPASDCNGQRRDFLKMMAAGVAVPVALPSLYGMYVGSSQMKVDDVAPEFQDLPAGLDGFTIIQISDLHVGPFMDTATLQATVRRINAMAPDLVVITGDIINWGSSCIDEAAEGISGLQAEQGVYAVLGNHDFYCNTESLCGKLEKKGVQMLRNSWREIRPEGGGLLQLVGIDDPQGQLRRDMHLPNLKKALQQAPGTGFRILLSHRPTVFDAAAAMGVRLTLAGHTHGGQIILPAGNVHNWSLARLFYERDYGLYDKNGSYLYINRGLGVVGPPMRINCPREITRIVLRRGHAKL
jgi:uncharacterized protein